MRTEYRMPALGADMDAGTVVQWHVAPGSRVKRGDVVAVVETDKGAIDVEIFEEGVIAELVVQPGTKVPVGTTLAYLDVDRAAAVGAPAPVMAGAVPAPGAAPVQERLAPGPAPARAREGPGESAAPPAAHRLRISPAARVRAKELGLEIERVKGTGPGGAITLEDVEKARSTAQPPPTGVREAPKGSMREAIASAMARSKREIPHYYLSLTADVTPAVEWLTAHNAAAPVTERLIFAALLVKAIALACNDEPGFSGFYRDGRFEAAPVVHVGVAVAIRGGGLVAPAIADTAGKPLPALMNEFRDIVARARAGRLRASELSAPTIILTSLGDSPVATVLPIIQPPQVAIVGAGAVAAGPWVADGQLAVRQLCTLSLAADHRVTDGRLGAQFLGRIARLVSTADSPVWRTA